MSLHKHKKPKKEKVILENSVAEKIYLAFRDGKKQTEQFKNGTPFEDSNNVKKEFQRIEQEVNIIMNKLEKPQTIEELTSLVSSELLDITVVVEDIVIFSTDEPENPPTWEEFKLSFVVEEII